MILSWNVRGLNNTGKCREVAARIKFLNPDFGILVETRVKNNKAEAIRNKLGKGWQYIDNYCSHSNGKIWVFWNNKKVKIVVGDKTGQSIHFGVYDLCGDLTMWCTALYASNLLEQRKKLWDNIEKLQASSCG